MEDLQIREFLGRAIPWPSPEDDGVVSLHTSPYFKGVAVRTIDQFMKELDLAREEETNIYFCTSQTREAKSNGHDKLVPSRKQINVNLLKAIWVDWDAGPDKFYKTSKDAAVALNKFLTDTALPKPSAIVASGSGGFHVYWFSDRPLIKGVWQPYANGLKALLEKHGIETDVGCTTDSVRILRVPGTKNFKHSPPKTVWQVGELGPDYDFSVALADLALNVAGTAPRKGLAPLPSGGLPIPARFVGRTDVIVVKDEQLPLGFPPMPAKQLRECLERIPNDKVSWERWNTTGMRIFAACDGEDYGREEWQRWSDTLVSDGRDSCIDRWNTYHTSPPTRTGAGALINEVRRLTGDERWLPARPQLARINDPEDWMLPDGFRLKDGCIEHKFVDPKKKSHGNDDDDDDELEDHPWIPFIKSKIVAKPWYQSFPHAGFQLHIQFDVKRTFKAFIPRVDFPKTKITQRMHEQNIIFNAGLSPLTYEKFFMSWVERMNNCVAANEKSKFGWEWDDENNTLPSAFVYGGRRYTNKGTWEEVGAIDEKMKREYYPQGTREPWDQAAKLVFGQKRPVLEIIVAAAIAGPLMTFAGESGAMLSVYSTGTGAHKSTASKIGAAIFGHPLNSRESTGSSFKGTTKRLGDVQHLTVQWDDINDEANLKTVSATAFQCSQGSGGTKLKQNREYADTGHWQTLLCSYSNASFVEYIVKKEPNNAAELSRVFEIYHTKRPEDETGMIEEGKAIRLLGELNRNFGHVGLKYAELLANNAQEVSDLVKTEMLSFREAIATAGTEKDSGNRYWVCVCAILLAAAKLGPQLGVMFDYDAVRQTLVEAFVDNCTKRTNEGVDGESLQHALTATVGFLKQAGAGYALWSQDSAKRGGHKEDKIRILQHPEKNREVFVQLITSERVIRISKRGLKKILELDRYNPGIVVRGLKKHFNADTDKKIILGAGSEYARGQEWIIEIPVPEGSPFEDVLFAHGGRADEQL